MKAVDELNGCYSKALGCAELLEGVYGVLIFNVKSIQMKISELIFGEL